MTRAFLRWHLWTWCLLPPAGALLLVLALRERPSLPPDQALPHWLVAPSVQPVDQSLKTGR